MPSDPLSVQITGREIYDAVIRLTGRVDVLIQQHEATQHDVQDHEDRIRLLERARWPLPSAAVLLSAAALVVTLLPKLT